MVNAAMDVHLDDPEFGYRSIADELPARGIIAGRAPGQSAVHPSSSRSRCMGGTEYWTASSDPPVHDDPVQPEFTADAPNRLWLTDITEHAIAEGKLYLYAVEDACTNRIVGYSIHPA